jgi:hypothetical protein
MASLSLLGRGRISSIPALRIDANRRIEMALMMSASPHIPILMPFLAFSQAGMRIANKII